MIQGTKLWMLGSILIILISSSGFGAVASITLTPNSRDTSIIGTKTERIFITSKSCDVFIKGINSFNLNMPFTWNYTKRNQRCIKGYENFIKKNRNYCYIFYENGACKEKVDYLILTTNNFDISKLQKYRKKTFSVDLINLPSEYSPEQIKDLIDKYNPTYVLIVGFDIPTKEGSDYYYETSQGIIKYAIGRLPVTNQKELDSITNKIISYEKTKQYLTKKVTIVAGNQITPGISNSSEILGYNAWRPATNLQIQLLPIYQQDYIIDQIYSISLIINGTVDKENRCVFNGVYCQSQKDEIIKSIQGGTKIVTYQGHSNYYILATTPGLYDSDAASLINQIYPIMIARSCSTIDYNKDSLANQGIVNERGGFIAFIGSIGSAGDNTFPENINNIIEIEKTLGKAFMESKKQSVEYSKKTFVLLGDPALKIN